MVTECRPLRDSGGLPPRRSELIQAAAAVVPESSSRSNWGDSINIPAARDRMLEYFEREQLPGDVKSTLAAALNGDLHLQSLLFTAMLDTWPKLQKNIAEIARLVSIAPWKLHPFAMRGDKPNSAAEKLAKDVENIVWTMKPRAVRGENGLEGTIKSLVMGYYYGHTVAETRWEKTKDGTWKPRCTKPVPARYYGYPYDSIMAGDPEDRLMFDPEGGMGARNFVDFPEHRFLVAIHRGHEGHAAVAAPLRALSGYWLAAVYGLKWFLNFTQLYGIPWRHAECEKDQENVVKAALASIGANGYIVTRPGTKINMVDAAANGTTLPQKALIDLADQQCDQFILGQTLTGGTDKSGSRALGEVHQGTLDGVIDGVADFVGEILTHQLIPAIVSVNWGEERDDLPEMWAKREETKDQKAMAERDEKIGITTGKVPVGKAWFYERHGIPMPAESDDLLIDEPELDDPNGGVPEPGKNPPENPTKPNGSKVPAGVPVGKKKPVEAADAAEWACFDSSLGIPRREMPQIRSGDRAAMVQFLRARGIESKAETVNPKSLKATQAEYSPAKVAGAKAFTGGNRAILISADGHVVDGHHQWRAALEDGKSISVIRLMAPITRVLMMVHRMPSTSVSAADAVFAIVQAGGFWTLDDGRVIYIEKTRTKSPGDSMASDYRKYGSSEKETADKNADKARNPSSSREPSPEDLSNPNATPDDDPNNETTDLEKARKDYEQEQLEESMSGFPEIGAELKGQLPRPEDLPADDPLRGEMQNIWDRFKKETRNEDGKGRAVIAPSGAAQYFAPKGTKVNLDDLRQRLNEQGFDFQNPGDMLGAVYESLEGRKKWGTMSRGDFDVAAADASEVARLESLMKQAEAALDGDGLLNEDAIASMLAAAWVSGAKSP